MPVAVVHDQLDGLRGVNFVINLDWILVKGPRDQDDGNKLAVYMHSAYKCLGSPPANQRSSASESSHTSRLRCSLRPIVKFEASPIWSK